MSHKESFNKVKSALVALNPTIKADKGDSFMACCPAHDDSNPSLGVKWENGKTICNCLVGCSKQSVLDAMGLQLSDLFDDTLPISRNASDAYVYRRDGKPYVIKEKFNRTTPTGKNDYKLKTPDGSFSKGATMPLYGEVPESGQVFLVESEKDKDNLALNGLTAVSTAGSGGWKTDMADKFKGLDVLLASHLDDAGLKHTQACIKDLVPVAKSITVLTLDGPEGYDVSDLLSAEDGLDRLHKMIEDTEPLITKARLKVIDLSKVEEKEVEYVWPEVFAKGMVTSLVSEVQSGKSTMMRMAQGIITTGGVWPGTNIRASKGDVIVFNHEEPLAQVVVPSLKAHSADLDRIHLAGLVEDPDGSERVFDIEFDMPVLEDLMVEYPDTKMVVFDPITSYTDCNENSNKEVRRALKPLVDFAEKHNIAVVILSHLNKKVDLDHSNRTMGSKAWHAVPRCSWSIKVENTVDEDTGDKTDTGSRYLSNTKCSYGRKPRGYKWSIDDNGKIVFEEGRFDVGMDDASKKLNPEDVQEWLRQLLDGEPMLASEVFKNGKMFGYGDKAIRAAFNALNANTKKPVFGGPSYWSLT